MKKNFLHILIDKELDNLIKRALKKSPFKRKSDLVRHILLTSLDQSK